MRAAADSVLGAASNAAANAATAAAGDAAAASSGATTSAGAPAFAVERLAFSGERPIEHRLVLAPGDRVTLTASWGDLG